MKIHYNKEFNCFETTECHKTDSIELDGVKLIPIKELEKIKTELEPLPITDTAIRLVLKLIDKHISELKGETE